MLSMILILVLTAGCSTAVEEETPEPTLVELEGYVAINRQGEEIDGDAGDITVRVDGEDESYTTDDNGYFSIELETGESYDLVATREGLATTKVQNLYVDESNPANELIILIKEEGPKDYNYDISDLNVAGVEDFDYTDEVEEITVSSDNPMYELYADMNNHYWKDYEVLGTIIDAGSEVPIGLDLNVNPGEDNQMLAVFAVDPSNNVVMEYFHLQMPDKETGLVPKEPNNIEVQSSTYRFSQSLLSHPDEVEKMLASKEISAASMPEGTMLWNTLSWNVPEDSDAETFNIYRSFDGDEYSLIETTSDLEFRDIHPEIEPGQEVWYRVKSVNQAGESDGYMEISVEPLPVFYISLVGPVSQDNFAENNLNPVFEDVPLEPYFMWNVEMDGIDLEELVYIFDIMLRRGTRNYDTLMDPFYGSDISVLMLAGYEGLMGITLQDLIDYDSEEAFDLKNLVRGETYEWGIEEAVAQKVNIDEDNRFSVSVSFGALGSFAIPDNSLQEFRTID